MKLLLIVFLITSVSVQAQLNANLRVSYLIKSKRITENFFEKWSKDIVQITEEDYIGLSDTLKAVYEAYSDLLSIKSEWYSSGYKPFAIIQCKIPDIFIVDKLFFTDQEIEKYIVLYINNCELSDSLKYLFLNNISDYENHIFSPYKSFNRFGIDFETKSNLEIINFKPKIDNNFKPLYYSDEYQRILHSFLNKSIFNKSLSNDSKNKRLSFISNFLSIKQGYEPNHKQYITQPQINRVFINKEINNIFFEISCGFNEGYVILAKEKDKWIVRKDKVEIME